MSLTAIKGQVSGQKTGHPLARQTPAPCRNRKKQEVCAKDQEATTWGREAGMRSHRIDSSWVLQTGQGGFSDGEELWGLETSSARVAF